MLFLFPVLLAGQNRDFHAERIVVDDNGSDGTQNTMTIQTPSPLGQDVILTIPDMGSDSAQFLLVPPGTTGAWLLGGNTGTTAGTDYLGTSDNTPLHIYVNGDPANSLILNTNQSIQRGTGGNSRGGWSVDLQITRTNASQVTSGLVSTIGGGGQNTVSSNGSTIAGGVLNVVSGHFASVGGGYGNSATGGYATVGGGLDNLAGGRYSTISGGYNNVVDPSALYSSISGGVANEVTGRRAVIVGGRGLTLNGDGVFGFMAGADAGVPDGHPGPQRMEINASNMAVFGNVDLWLANNDGVARRLLFYEAESDTGNFPSTTHYTSFAAGDQTENINYILPTTPPGANNQVLSSDTNGGMSWVDASSVAWSLTGNAGTTAGTNYVGTSDATGLHLYARGGPVYDPLFGALIGGNSLILSPDFTIQRDDRGDARGRGAIDLQMQRQNNSEVASGNWTVIAGGVQNTAQGEFSTVSGGSGNAILSNLAVGVVASTVGGGYLNEIAGSEWGVIGGGHRNNVSGSQWATIGGGRSNSASADYAVISGGRNNRVSGEHSAVGGGWSNIASALNATVSGGRNNIAAGDYSSVLGGRNLTLDSTAAGSLGFLGDPNGIGPMTISEPQVTVFGNTDLWLANNDGGASRLLFYEAESDTGVFPSNTHFTSLEAGNQNVNIRYILPATPPTANGQVLSSTTGGVMSWVDGPTGSQSFSNASNTMPTLALENNIGTDDGVALEIVEGRMILSNGQGAPTNIPDDVIAFEIDDATVSSAPTVGLPASGTNGQILYILVSDPDGATVGGVGRASGDKLTYLYLGGGWQLFHAN